MRGCLKGRAGYRRGDVGPLVDLPSEAGTDRSGILINSVEQETHARVQPIPAAWMEWIRSIVGEENGKALGGLASPGRPVHSIGYCHNRPDS